MRSFNLMKMAVLTVIVVFLSSCGLSKMVKKYDTVKYEVTPTVLETHGGKISVKVKGTIPEKYFHKNATVEFTPVLKYANGTTALKSITIQGEKSKATGGTVIKKKSGGTFTYEDVITYTPDMNKSELVVNAKATLKKTVKELGEKKLADGVIYTSTRIEKEGDVSLAEHGYVKETIISKSAEIFFAKAISDLNLKTVPLNKDEANKKKLADFIAFLKNDWKIKNVDITAWASPEGEETYNAGLSERRSKTADTYLKDELKKLITEKAKANKEKVDKKKLDEMMPVSALSAKGEDWDGFLSALGASNIKEKNTILNVVNSQSDPLKKETEINNMTVIYPEIEELILPPLRRSTITINYFEPKLTDQQIAMYATTQPDSLDNKELLYAATLTEDLNTQLKIYDAATKVYPQDWKGYNNAGYVSLKLGKLTEAASYYEKANSLSTNNGIVINGLGVVSAWKKEYDNAKSYYETAQGLGIDENFNLAVISITKGDYAGALTLYGSRTCTHNIALAQLLSGNPPSAATTLECTTPKTAAVYYLMAIVGARSGNTSMIYENLPKAISMDPSYRSQAADDREFLKFNTTAEFLNAIK
jgi:tetratricopeptide (TPR) repeat protein